MKSIPAISINIVNCSCVSPGGKRRHFVYLFPEGVLILKLR